MADEQTNSEGADEQSGNDDSAGEDHKVSRLKKDLHAHKARTREAEAKLAEYERQRQDAEAERERSNGDRDAQIKRLSAQLQDAQGQIAERDSKLSAYEKATRHGAIVERLATDGGVSNRKLLGRLLDVAGLDDADPESLTDGDYKHAIKTLRKEAPELFTTTTTTTIKPPPGQGQRPSEKNEDYYKAAAAARSSRGPSAAYDKARGRTG